MANPPSVDFTGKAPGEIEASIITLYEATSGRKIYPGDPVRLFLETIAAIIVQQRVLIDFSAKQNLLFYSSGNYLDQIGYMYGDDTERLPASEAIVTLRYTIAAPQLSVFTVPVGEQATDGKIIFATTTELNIPPGSLFGDVTAKALIAGTAANGLLPGQIKTQVQPRPLVQAVANVTTSSGGSAIEDDENYRERIRLAPGQFSVAGPTAAYEFWARSASQEIDSVGVDSPVPGEVKIYPLMRGGVLPTNDILQAVDAVLNSDNIRPLTDKVEVLAPNAVNYNIDVQYWINSQVTTNTAAVQSAVQAAVQAYAAWQKSRIGQDIVPDELTKRMISAGAKRVNIVEPVFTPVMPSEVAQDVIINVNFQGLENA
jgi:phage-related baseplate assembly protein